MPPKLIVIRGNSGSGKSTLAKLLKEKALPEAVLIEQDYIRRTLLNEKEKEQQRTIHKISTLLEESLKDSRNVVLEGILGSKRYDSLFASILKKPSSDNYFFYMKVSFEETLRRHKTKPNKHEFGEKEMKEWYKENDLLSCAQEIILPERNSLEENLKIILKTINVNF